MSDIPSTKYQTFQMSDTDTQTVADGEPIIVHSISTTFSHTPAQTLILTDNDDNPIVKIIFNGLNSSHYDIPFIAYNGLKIPPLTTTINYLNAYITVRWRPTG